ncbi:class I SAM-dependent methyltransferase [Halobium salinum]|uniref:Class I SAM-dependent methyltransferase n=1 Tax=Halobium salinum TaxID=1364940 RepID=A0ABD5PCE7_9EURY|nr:class I SAM-dependent methyltransferase [Halobium salinum]
MPTREYTGYGPDVLFLLWAARRTGVLEALTDAAGTPEDVACRAGVTDEAARVVVYSLADLGFLARVGDEYEPTNRLLGFLAKRDVRSIGRLPHALDELDLLVELPETMRTGERPDLPEDWRVNQLGAHAATDEALVRARVTAAVRAHPGAERVLDVCGGSGVHGVEFAERGRSVTVLDDPETREIVGGAFGDRVETTCASLAALGGEDYDLAFAAGTLHEMAPAECEAYLARVYNVLAADGVAVFVDVFRDRADPERVASVATRALARGDGGVHTTGDVEAWAEAAGFETLTVDAVPGTGEVAAVAHKHDVH